MKFSLKQKIAAAAAAATIVGGAGVAVAYWTTGGAGTGSARTDTSTAVIVTQVGTIAGLVPGGPASSIDFKINNPAAFNQYITGVAIVLTGVVGGSDATKSACTIGDFILVQPTATYGDLISGDHSYVGGDSGASLALDNTATNQDNCKDATVSLSITAS